MPTKSAIITKAGQRLGVAIFTAVATAVVVGEVSFASIPSGSGVIHGCYITKGMSHALTIIDSAKMPNCPSGYTSLNWSQTGPQGPSGVVRMDSFDANNYGANPSGTTWAFVSDTVPEVFTNSDTAATVTGTIDYTSMNSGAAEGYLGVCYEPSGSSTLVTTGYISPAFTLANGSYIAETISATAGNLSAGTYKLGLCAKAEINVIHGLGHGTIILAQTASGSSDPMMPADLTLAKQ